MAQIISDEALQKQIGWTPHIGQKEVLSNKSRDKVVCAGTRWGKSKLCAYVAFKYLLADNQKIWVVSLTYDMAKKIFDYVQEFAGRWDKRILKGVSTRPIPRFEVKEWGSWLECKSIETPTSLMGEELDLCIIDEAARMKSEIWERFLMARLTSRKGKSFTISTPFGKNWFFRRYLQTRLEDGAFHYESRDNPFFPLDEWERAKDRLPEDIFNQEYRALFIEGGASVFRGVREIVSGQLQDYKTGHFYVMGVDLGKYRDFTVICVINRASHHLVHFERFNKIDWNFQKERIIAVSERYKRPEIWLDSTGVGDPISEDLKRRSLNVNDFKYTNTSKEQLIQKLSIYIQQKRITYPEIGLLLDELESFGMDMTEGGKIKYGAPQGLHDDCVNSLALAVWSLSERPVTFRDSEILIPRHIKY